MKVINIDKILKVLGIVFLGLTANFILYAAFGSLYTTLIAVALVIVPLYFAYKLLRSLVMKMFN